LRFQVIVQCVQGRIGLAQCGENAGGFAVLTQRQKTAITARVGDDFVGFVERLGDIQSFLGAEAELLRTDFLQGAQIEG